MPSNRVALRRNLFELENARNLNRDDLVATFVPTPAFWRLLSAKNHVVLGARGSGKTALAKMLSHDHLSRLRDERALEAIASRRYIGLYIPTSIEWVGALKNKPWQTEAQAEEFFSWRLNVSSCRALLTTIQSCLDTYIPDRGKRAMAEATLCSELSQAWSDGAPPVQTIRGLQRQLEDQSYRKQQQLARARAHGYPDDDAQVGIAFSTELFAPLKRGITLTRDVLGMPQESVWLVCLDEAEFLQPVHHRIVNSFMRSASHPLAFKITTMPYCHYTLDTNSSVPLNVGHDFEYVYIDQDPVSASSSSTAPEHAFATALFQRRAKHSSAKLRRLSLEAILGPSILLDEKAGDWGPDSSNMALLRQYGSPETVARATALLASDQARFMDQIGRKLHGALLLRHAVATVKGRAELGVYAGTRMVIRCGDANPRRLIRIFNSLLLETEWEDMERPPWKRVRRLSQRAQTRILTALSHTTLVRVQSEPDLGPDLFAFLNSIGSYMHTALHDGPLTTDQISSIRVESNVDDHTWSLIKNAVTLGLLFPNISANNPDEMPSREGTYHLAYVLAPEFRLLPRRGKARSLRTILKLASPPAGDVPQTASDKQRRLPFD